MGLAGVKNRRKLGKDPNNTRWSRNEDTFGQKILRNQGWQPGQFLGVQGSAHSAHHTAANASHIRVAFRDNNAGIGMKMGTTDQSTGMGAFQDLLGRLNGKSEEKIQLERKVREDYKANIYVERKYGGMRFVKGGLLVGDKIKSLDDRIEKDAPAEPSESEQQTSIEPKPQSEQATGKKSKDRKNKKEKNSKKRKAINDTPDAEPDSLKTKKRKKVESRGSDNEVTDAPIIEFASSTDSFAGEVTKKRKKNKVPKDEKAGKERKKGKNEKRLSGDDYDKSIVDSKQKEEKKKRKDKGSNESSEETEEPSTQPSLATSREASVSGTSTPRHQPIGARRLHRSKFIASKRAAVMDQVALNQIFMIKSAAGA